MAVKKRKISFRGQDGKNVAEFIKKKLEARRGSPYRKKAEAMWKEVDRQVAMEGMSRDSRNPEEPSDNWRSAIELGELSRASEVLSADVRRMAFPQNRSWFDPHVKLDNEDLKIAEQAEKTESELQEFSDGALRALMAQQQLDFAFKARTDLSIKEALHHGSYVAEVENISMLGSSPDGTISDLNAPVWVPHSMWNCYPDDSPSVMAGTLFYTGSMIICSYMSHQAIMGVKGDGWIKDNINDLPDPKDKDHEISWYYGDITLPRAKGADIYLPNVKAGSIKGVLIYYKPNDLKHSRIIYNGYERLDVRSPYYISPLIKMSPTQKVASVLTNKLIDSVELKVEPPIVYDGNDPDLAQTGGPATYPGAKTPSKNLANFKEIDIGDPGAALTAVQFHIAELQKGTSVDSIRSGMSSSTEQTATEVERTRQGGQIRTIDFLDKHELQGLRPFLYLQHESNKKNLKSYQFYSPEMDSPDFVTVTNKDLPETVHFDVVGSKGMIEEGQRQAATMQVTNFAYSVGAGSKIDIDKLLKEMFQDAGNKNPERFLRITDKATTAQQLEQVQQQLEQITEQAQQIQAENESLKQQEETKIQEIQAKASIEMARQDNDEDKIEKKAQLDMAELEAQTELNEQKLENDLILNQQKTENDKEVQMFKVFTSNVGQPTEDADEDDDSPSTEDMMVKFEEALARFTEAQTAKRIVTRNKEGFIESIETEGAE